MGREEALKRTEPRFHVYIVESPGPLDLYDDRTEGALLQKALTLAGVRSTLRLAVNEETFRKAMTSCVDLAGHVSGVFLHLSVHGNSQGIQLTDGRILTWEVLKKILLPINSALGNSLILCMSTCEGVRRVHSGLLGHRRRQPLLCDHWNHGQPSWVRRRSNTLTADSTTIF